MLRRGSIPSRLAALALAALVVAAFDLAVVRPGLTKYADDARRIEALGAELAKLDAAAATAAARLKALERDQRIQIVLKLRLPSDSLYLSERI